MFSTVQYALKRCEQPRTADVRAIAKAFKKPLSHLSMNTVYDTCESLLKTGLWAETICAYQLIYDQKKRYDEATFDVFERWLFAYIKDWWDCDDFMTHAFQTCLMLNPNHINRVKTWVNHERFAVRRAAAVILIVPVKKNLIDIDDVFYVCNQLMLDTHDLVQKGYGWLLKESTRFHEKAVIAYLERNVHQMPRTAFRYALERLDASQKARLMQLP